MLRTEELVKRFGAIVAVDRVSVQIPTGQDEGGFPLLMILAAISLIDLTSKTLRLRLI